jgi:hypothetical protein
MAAAATVLRRAHVSQQQSSKRRRTCDSDDCVVKHSHHIWMVWVGKRCAHRITAMWCGHGLHGGGVACTNDGRARWARVWAVDQALGASTALTVSVWAVVLQSVTGVQESALASNLACTPKWEVKQRQWSRRSFQGNCDGMGSVGRSVADGDRDGMVGQTAGQVRLQRQGRGRSKGHR